MNYPFTNLHLTTVCSSRDYCSAKVRLRSASVKAGPTVAMDKIFLARQEYFRSKPKSQCMK